MEGNVSVKPCHRRFRQSPTCGYVDRREMIEVFHHGSEGNRDTQRDWPTFLEYETVVDRCNGCRACANINHESVGFP